MITKPVVPVNSLGLTIIDLTVQPPFSPPLTSIFAQGWDIKHIICARHQVHRFVFMGSKVFQHLKINLHIT